MLQLLGDFVAHRGFACGPHCGLPSPDPLTWHPLLLCITRTALVVSDPAFATKHTPIAGGRTAVTSTTSMRGFLLLFYSNRSPPKMHLFS